MRPNVRASEIDLFLGCTEGVLTLTVQDDGSGLPENFDKRAGMGLTGMRSRAELIGARLDSESSPERGTVVTCRLPSA